MNIPVLQMYVFVYEMWLSLVVLCHCSMICMFLKDFLVSKERKKRFKVSANANHPKTKQRKTLIEETRTEHLETLENDCNSDVDENGCTFEKIRNRFVTVLKMVNYTFVHPVHRLFSNTLYNE